MLEIDHKKELSKLINSFGYKYSTDRVFSDFVELGAISISNAVDKAQRERREKRYLQLIENYEEKEAQIFPKLMTVLTDGLEHRMTDLFGETFMELDLGNDDNGQFFTPYDVSQLMAEMAFGDIDEKIKEKGYVGVNEPAVGGGVTIIALAEAMQKRGYNYQKQMKVVCQDIDSRSVHMAYLQLSLLGIDATVLRGNTLTLKMNESWHTPMKMMNRIQDRNRQQTERMIEKMKQESHRYATLAGEENLDGRWTASGMPWGSIAELPAEALFLLIMFLLVLMHLLKQIFVD